MLLLSIFSSAQGNDNPPNNTNTQEQSNPVIVTLKTFLVNTIDGVESFKESNTARPGQVVEYRLDIQNKGDEVLPAGIVSIVGPILEGTTYVLDSATKTSNQVLTEFSTDTVNFSVAPVLIGDGSARREAKAGEYKSVRWTILEDMAPGKIYNFVYRVKMDKN